MTGETERSRHLGWTRWAVLGRSLAVQGSWNYETLTGTGFAFAILPALRRIHTGDPEALDEAIRRHERPFNCHPYLAPLALGAVIRMEQDGEPAEVIERFKAALRGSLGTLGDQLVWTGWRPVCLLAMLGMLVVGLPWWFAVAAFLVAYNIGHLALMAWGLHVGLAEGRGMASRLRYTVHSSQPRLMVAGAFLGGMVMSLVALEGLPGLGAARPAWVWPFLAGAAVVVGARWGDRVRGPAVLTVMILAAVGLVAGWVT